MRDRRVAGSLHALSGFFVFWVVAVFAAGLGLVHSPQARAAGGDVILPASPLAPSSSGLPGGEGIDALSASSIHEAFLRLGYRLEAVRDGLAEVPPVFLSQVPSGLEELPSIDVRKAVFQKVVLPLVLAVNAEVAEDRARLFDLQARLVRGEALSSLDRRWLESMGERYEIPRATPLALLERVDAIPPSLALGQSAIETGWGRDRALRESRNLFGHSGSSRFKSLREAVEAYVHNLNTHPRYESLRVARAQARARGETVLDGDALAPTLKGYSERGMVYVQALQSLMRSNDLGTYDAARLGRTLPRRWALAD